MCLHLLCLAAANENPRAVCMAWELPAVYFRASAGAGLLMLRC